MPTTGWYTAAPTPEREVPRRRLAVARTWRVYHFWGRVPTEARFATRLVDWLVGPLQICLYVGQTGQYPHLARALQHAKEQRWAGEVELFEFDPRIYLTEADALAAERAAIVRYRPLHNVVGNRLNPRAVPAQWRRLPRAVIRRRQRRTAWAVVLVGVVAVAALAWGWR